MRAGYVVGMKISTSTAPSTSMMPTERAQAVVYRQAIRHEPVTIRPTSGTMAAINSR